MAILLFLISLGASIIGAIVGAGGGVIIKPVVDAAGLLPVSSVSFLSGCTVLAMSCCSMIRCRKNKVVLRLKTTVPLALGAAGGGIVGKLLFELFRGNFGNERILGMVQAACLTLITAIVLIYVATKDRLPSKQVDSRFAAFFIGTVLGCISSFLGIGGGTSNVAVLFFFFSMDAKQAAKNSLFIIMFSQFASILFAILTNTIPTFQPINLVCMALGGIGGAIIGAKLSERLTARYVETALKLLLAVIVLINLSNFIKFMGIF